MPEIRAIKRNDLISYLIELGFSGPYCGEFRLTIPNPHQGDIGINLLSKILKQAQISKEQWKSL